MCTKFNGTVSNMVPLKCGVPHGSVIGPILFLCYINDIVGIAESNNGNISLYADDAVFYSTSNDVNLLHSRLQCMLDKVVTWCQMNCINLNVKKTKLCCYCTRTVLKETKLSLKDR